MRLPHRRRLWLLSLSAALTLGVLSAGADDEAPAEEPAVLDVRVLDHQSGQAVVGARVVVYDEAYQPVREGETDAGGHVRLHFPQGRYGAVAALADDHAFGHQSLYSMTGRSRTCELVLRLRPALVLTGRVLDAQSTKPIAGARLTLRVLTVGGLSRSIFWRLHEAVESTETDMEGGFTLRRVPANQDGYGDRPFSAIQIEADGFADVAKVLWRPQEIPDAFSILLPRGGRVVGTVRTADGGPAANVIVGSPTTSDRSGDIDRRLLSTDDWWFTMSNLPRTPPVLDLWQGHRTRTDAEGRFVLDGLIAGRTIPISAKAGEPELRSLRIVTIPHDPPTTTCDLVLRGDATLVVQASRGDLAVRDGQLSGRGAEVIPVPDAGVELNRGGRPPRFTDEHGEVRFDDLLPGKYVVSAWKDGLGERRAYVTVSAGEAMTTHVRFWNSGERFTYRGLIVDDRGEPIEGATCWVTPGGYETKTDAEGRFAYEAPGLDGMWLEARAEGHAGRRRELADVEDREELTFVLPRMTPVTVRARVHPEGPVPSRHLEVFWSGWGVWQNDAEWPIPRLPLAVTLPVDPDTPWIRLDAGPFAPLVWHVDVQPGVPLDLPVRTLDLGLTLEGTLLDAEGKPVDGRRRWGCDLDLPYYEVEVYQQPHARTNPGARRRRAAVPGAEGGWRIEGLVPGRTTVDVVLRYDTWLRFPVDVDTEMAPLEIRLPSPCRLAGRVVDPEGRPHVMATVRLHAFLTRLWPSDARKKLIREIPTDSGGRYAFQVPPGSYRVEVVWDASRSKRDDVAAVQFLTLEAGQTKELDLVASRTNERR